MLSRDDTTLKKDRMSAGYSKNPLAKKLGITPDFRICLINPPDNYNQLLGAVPAGVQQFTALNGEFDLIQYFTKSQDELTQQFPLLKSGLKMNGALWISWPKKASGVVTDLTEDIIRQIGLDNGLVDVKVVAVDDTWSGLKFVYRLQDR